MTPDLDKLATADLAVWLAALREASAADPSEAAARALELEAQRVELEMQNRELRRTQAALMESHARYRDLYDFAPVAYVKVGLDGKIEEANLTAATLLGVERPRLVGRRLVAHVARRDRDRFREHLRRCFESVLHVSSEIRVSRGGEEVITHVISIPIVSTEGELVGCKTTLADISAIKRGEARLTLLARASLLLAAPLVDDVPCEEVLRLLVPEFADLAALDLLDDRGQLRPAALAGAGASLERRAAAISPSAAWSEGGIPAALAGGEPLFLPDCLADTLARHGLEHEPLLAACGATSALLVSIESRGVHFGVLTLAATDGRRLFAAPDRTVAQELAARLALALHNARLYRNARDAIKAREEVLAYVAHDLRNPVHAIGLSLAGVLDAAPKEERRRGWQRLDRVRRTAQQMDRMIDDLLDLSSVDAGQLRLELADCHVLGVIQDVQDALGPLVDHRGVRLAVDASEADAPLRCDATRVLQVFSNVVGNAVKFTPPGGTITISARPRSGDVLFSVADTGDGVAVSELERLFDRYWQADAHAHKSRGLGLYIARKIVEAHGGKIWAEGEAGRGTTLHFTLPSAHHPADPTSPGQSAGRPRGVEPTAPRAADPQARLRTPRPRP